MWGFFICFGFCVYSALFVAHILGAAAPSRYTSLLTPALNAKSSQDFCFGFFPLFWEGLCVKNNIVF